MSRIYTHAGAAREHAHNLCRCAKCGVTAECTPAFDFVGDPGQPLLCSDCTGFWMRNDLPANPERAARWIEPDDKANTATVHVGDALDWLRSLPSESADGFVTDPPYTAAGGNSNGRSSAHDHQFWSFWFSAVFAEMARVTRPDGCGFIFSDWRMMGPMSAAIRGGIDRHTARGWEASQAIVWDRESIGLGQPFRSAFEMILFVRGPKWKHDPDTIPRNIGTVLHHRWPYGRHEHHSAEKPVELLDRLVRWCVPNGGAVLDPFAGSGSAGVAAVSAGRRYLGCEILADDAAVAERRIREVSR